ESLVGRVRQAYPHDSQAQRNSSLRGLLRAARRKPSVINLSARVSSTRSNRTTGSPMIGQPFVVLCRLQIGADRTVAGVTSALQSVNRCDEFRWPTKSDGRR